MRAPTLFLSKDRMHLMDDQDCNISARMKEKNVVYYQVIGIQSEGFKRVCKETNTLKVCTAWDGAHECQVWDEVNVCTKWELVPAGFSNIS